VPNPLTRVRPDCAYEYGPNSLGKRPELAVQIMSVIGNISSAENARGLILAELLGVEEHFALLMYLEVKNASAKSAAFDAIAKTVLSEEDSNLLKLIDRKSKSIFTRRNDFAHGLWGVSEELPDAILWIPADHYLDHVLESGSGKKHVMAMLHDRNRVMVYTATELSEDVARSERANFLYRSFHSMLFGRRFKDDPMTDHLLGPNFHKGLQDTTRKQIVDALGKE
jgi:hypothetical protein